MPQRDSVGHTFNVAVTLCLVCATVVSAAAVLLRERQQQNRSLEERKNVLIAADDLFDPVPVSQGGKGHTNADVPELFEQVAPKVVDLAGSDWYVDAPDDYNQRQATQDRTLSDAIPDERDVAGIKRREKLSYVYLVIRNGTADQVVLPIRGYGLWSTLWGFISIDLDSLKQGPEHAFVRGLTFYEHKETPGLGGEVDNPRWKQSWKGKHIFDADWNVILEVVKRPSEPDHEVDGLSGATITSNGVSNMIQYWLGEEGFGPYLTKLQRQLNEESGI